MKQFTQKQIDRLADFGYWLETYQGQFVGVTCIKNGSVKFSTGGDDWTTRVWSLAPTRKQTKLQTPYQYKFYKTIEDLQIDYPQFTKSPSDVPENNLAIPREEPEQKDPNSIFPSYKIYIGNAFYPHQTPPGNYESVVIFFENGLGTSTLAFGCFQNLSDINYKWNKNKNWKECNESFIKRNSVPIKGIFLTHKQMTNTYPGYEKYCKSYLKKAQLDV